MDLRMRTILAIGILLFVFVGGRDRAVTAQTLLTTEQAQLTASDGAPGDLFGRVAIANGTVVVGARGNDDAGSQSGSAYVFELITDSDGDGVPDDKDDCPDSDLSPTVVIDGCNSGVTNTGFPSGCRISDFIAACAEGASNHGQFVSCVSQVTNDLKKAGTITGQQKGAIQSCAAKAHIP